MTEGHADELRAALPAEDVLTRRSRVALVHYREQATRARRQAAADRARAYHLDDDARHALMRGADELDARAAQWEALAAELEAFADQVAGPAQEVLL